MLQHNIVAQNLAVHLGGLVDDAGVGQRDDDPFQFVGERVLQGEGEQGARFACACRRGERVQPRLALRRLQRILVDRSAHSVHGRRRRTGEQGVLVLLELLPQGV